MRRDRLGSTATLEPRARFSQESANIFPLTSVESRFELHSRRTVSRATRLCAAHGALRETRLPPGSPGSGPSPNRSVSPMRMLVRGFAVLVVTVLIPSAAFAQASIAGVVRDTSGGVLPGVTVEA